MNHCACQGQVSISPGFGMYPHRIRLRGPWECEPLSFADPAHGQPLPAPRRMVLPCRWRDGGLPDFAGRVRFRRRFGYPGQIDDDERVWLTCEGLTGSARLCLNGEALNSPDNPEAGFEYKVTPLLRPRNELLIEIDGPGEGGLWGEIAMEIRRTAFLRDVRIAVEVTNQRACLRARGMAVGTADRPLDLYLLLDRSSIAYGRVTPFPGGMAFDLLSEPVALPSSAVVRVELVDTAIVWYSWERTIDFSSPDARTRG